jgi:hypothetical protein
MKITGANLLIFLLSSFTVFAPVPGYYQAMAVAFTFVTSSCILLRI